MPETSAPWLEAVRQIVEAVRESDVTSLQLARGDFSVRLRRIPSSRAPDNASVEDAALHRVRAPFTGIFFRGPTPGAPAYVNVGDWVETDAIIGLVETMKIFNEVTADCSGRIVDLPLENGQLVQAGDVVATIEPGGRAVADVELGT